MMVGIERKKTPRLHRVLEKRELTSNTFVLRLERKGLEFIPGQFVSAGPEHSVLEREYSIYSGVNDPYIELLIREILEGDISRKLHMVNPGENIRLSDPEGSMILDKEEIHENSYVFIGSGTGIAPFRSFVRSYPEMDYRVILGVRFKEEAYDIDDYERDRFTLCTSYDRDSDYYGRVTGYLRENRFNTAANFYVCGNSHMIYEVYRILREHGVDDVNLHSEVFF